MILFFDYLSFVENGNVQTARKFAFKTKETGEEEEGGGGGGEGEEGNVEEETKRAEQREQYRNHYAFTVVCFDPKGNNDLHTVFMHV